jgi:hypothetical protein
VWLRSRGCSLVGLIIALGGVGGRCVDIVAIVLEIGGCVVAIVGDLAGAEFQSKASWIFTRDDREITLSGQYIS